MRVIAGMLGRAGSTLLESQAAYVELLDDLANAMDDYRDEGLVGAAGPGRRRRSGRARRTGPEQAARQVAQDDAAEALAARANADAAAAAARAERDDTRARAAATCEALATVLDARDVAEAEAGVARADASRARQRPTPRAVEPRKLATLRCARRPSATPQPLSPRPRRVGEQAAEARAQHCAIALAGALRCRARHRRGPGGARRRRTG